MAKSKRMATVLQNECVACGHCVKQCPVQAIEIFKGIYAQVKEELCIGCGKCVKACPASVISIRERVSR